MASLQTNSQISSEKDNNTTDLQNGVLATLTGFQVVKRDGSLASLMVDKIMDCLQRTCKDIGLAVSQNLILDEVVKNLFNLIKTHEVVDILILSSAVLIEKDPAYSKVAARFLLQKIYKDAKGVSTTDQTLDYLYRQAFITGIHKGVAANHFDARLLEFDLNYLSTVLVVARDHEFEYLGLQTLYDRYLTRLSDGSRRVIIETPQAFWMRIAMGLAINEPNKNE